MKLKDIQAILNAKGLTGEENPELEVQSACSSDMMSDVLAFPKEHMVLLTGLVNPQVMRTADMLDIRMVVFVRGKQPAEEALELARESGISVLSTEHTLFNASGILFMHGLNNNLKG